MFCSSNLDGFSNGREELWNTPTEFLHKGKTTSDEISGYDVKRATDGEARVLVL